jgi:very-short-patch-repair endonuclease
VRCKPCAARITSRNTMANPEIRKKFEEGRARFYSTSSPEFLSERGKYARSRVSKESMKRGRMRQHETIKNDPEKYKIYCEKRKKIAIDFHNSLSEEDKVAHYNKAFKNRPTSKAEDEFFDCLEQHGLVFERQKCLSGFFVDGYVASIKCIIEFYGDTYHCNPKKYKDENQYCSWISRTVGEQWKRDQRRLACFYKNGCQVIIVWHSDWIKDQNREIRRIQDALSAGRISPQ